jgi:hypothetical protein
MDRGRGDKLLDFGCLRSSGRPDDRYSRCLLGVGAGQQRRRVGDDLGEWLAQRGRSEDALIATKVGAQGGRRNARDGCAFAFPPEWTTGVADPLRMKLLHWGAVGTEVGNLLG